MRDQFLNTHLPELQPASTDQLVDLSKADTAEYEAALSIALELQQRIPESRVLAVGGFIRDQILGKESKDLDIEVYGVDPEELHSVLEELFPEKVNAVGKAFGVLKLHLGHDQELDISIPRRDSKISDGHRGFEIEGDPTMSVEEAARRRDFTMNAMSVDLLTGELIDPFGGLSDLERGVIRVVDAETFREDPLRVYRAVQFASRFNLKIEEKTTELLERMIEDGELEHLPAERVHQELEKLLLKSEKPSAGFEVMDQLGILEKYFPAIANLKGVEQDPKWHPEGDVYKHTMLVVDAAAMLMRAPEADFSRDQKLTLMLTALCHDLGKQTTTVVAEDGKIRAPGHERAADEFIDQILEQIAVSRKVENDIRSLTYQHMRPYGIEGRVDRGELDQAGLINETRKLFRDTYPASFELLLVLNHADRCGKGEDMEVVSADFVSTLRDTAILNGLDHRELLRGRDLIEIGLEPGPELGRIISEVELHRDRGRVTNREDALAYVKDRYLVSGADLIERGVEPGPEVGKRMKEIKALIRDGELCTRSEILNFLNSVVS